MIHPPTDRAGDRAAPDARRPRRCEVLFDGSFRGTGWFPTEETPDYYFRWMGGDGSATVEFAVDRVSDLEILVYVPYIIDLTRWDALRFAVDGVPVSCIRENTAVQQSAEMNYYVLRVPGSPDHRGLTELRIEAPFGGQPSLTDPRRLSVGVCRILARPWPPLDAEAARAGLDAAAAAYLRGLGARAPVRTAA